MSKQFLAPRCLSDVCVQVSVMKILDPGASRELAHEAPNVSKLVFGLNVTSKLF